MSKTFDNWQRRTFLGKVIKQKTFTTEEVINLLLSNQPKEEAIRLYIESKDGAPFTFPELVKVLGHMPKSTIGLFLDKVLHRGEVKCIGRSETLPKKPRLYATTKKFRSPAHLARHSDSVSVTSQPPL